LGVHVILSIHSKTQMETIDPGQEAKGACLWRHRVRHAIT